MKTLPQKVAAVKRVFDRLDGEIENVQKQSGLHCLQGCGECCKKPDIEATALEFLPLALKLYDEGRAEEVLEDLHLREDAICYVFRPNPTRFGGLCNEYPERGLICRLFGFTARRNKEGGAELVTCKLIKESQAEEFEQLSQELRAGKKIPVMSDYYSRMASIDHELMNFYPINEAMKRALEIVLAYYAYRTRRKR